MDNTRTLKVGDIAPDFVLKDHHNHEFRLGEQKGKRVLLSFHPLAWTPVCGEQMKDIESQAAVFAGLNTMAVGLSVDSVPSKHAWAKSIGLKKTPLLSDFWPHGQVAHALGLFREEDGFSERANVLIDEHGRVAFIKIYPIPERPALEEILAVLKG
ncbi:MAG: redoxin domain-containing protein [Candidatus Aminicenantes bacterium]|nr:redoxin domain-containing protein [Candidatus Aminicenantes bacterium]